MIVRANLKNRACHVIQMVQSERALRICTLATDGTYTTRTTTCFFIKKHHLRPCHGSAVERWQAERNAKSCKSGSDGNAALTDATNGPTTHTTLNAAIVSTTPNATCDDACTNTTTVPTDPPAPDASSVVCKPATPTAKSKQDCEGCSGYEVGSGNNLVDGAIEDLLVWKVNGFMDTRPTSTSRKRNPEFEVRGQRTFMYAPTCHEIRNPRGHIIILLFKGNRLSRRCLVMLRSVQDALEMPQRRPRTLSRRCREGSKSVEDTTKTDKTASKLLESMTP